nr:MULTISPECIES: superinfection exclusion B family protein [Bacillota]
MCAISIATGLVLFLPDSFIQKMYMIDFRNKYGFTIGLIFLISISIVTITIVVSLYKYFSNKHFWKKFKDTAKERLLKLDDYQKTIVYVLYKEDNHTEELPIHDGAVRWLKQNMVITETTNQYMVSDLNNAVFPFMLNPWVVEAMQNDEELVNEFSKAYKKMESKYNKMISNRY